MYYFDVSYLVYDQSEVDEVGIFIECVFKSKEMLLFNLYEYDIFVLYEKMFFEMWGNKIQILCLLLLMFGNILFGVFKLVQCDEQVFIIINFKLLWQIVEWVLIVIDNVFVYCEIQCLKEWLVDENFVFIEQFNNVESEFGEIIGCSEVMNNVFKQVEMVVQSDSIVLIFGEIGIGKEFIVCVIYNFSGCNGWWMVKMNCVVMFVGLLESDLFGYECGVFIGVSVQCIGCFELVDKSFLFFDEVGDMLLELQFKLLCVFQEQEFECLGSNKLIQIDV